MSERPSWHQYFLTITHQVAERSTCTRAKVGAVIVRDKNINATAQAAKNGASIRDADIYITHTPCIHCLKVLINTGIRRIFYERDYKTHTLDELLRYTEV